MKSSFNGSLDVALQDLTPRLPGNELIVTHQNKIESFTYSFSTHRRMAFRGGLSSPANAEDGTIYAVDWEKNELWAF